MSDGLDAPKSYGYNDVFDDPDMHWSRYSHSMRVSVINRCATLPLGLLLPCFLVSRSQMRHALVEAAVTPVVPIHIEKFRILWSIFWVCLRDN